MQVEAMSAGIRSRIAGLRERVRRHPDATLAVEGLLLFIASIAIVQFVAWVGSVSFGDVPPSLNDLCRWDCHWYATITKSGYQYVPRMDYRGYANWAFFPLFPACAWVVNTLFHVGTSISLVLVSRFWFLVAIVSFMFLVRRLLDDRSALLAGAVLAFSPYLVYGHAGYSESIYFALNTIGFLLLYQRRWVWAGVVGGLISGTRVVGILFALPYLVHVFRDRAHWREEWPRMLVGTALLPTGLMAFSFTLRQVVGDGLAFEHVQVAWGRALGNPLEVLHLGFISGDWHLVFTIIGIASLLMSVWFIAVREYEFGFFLFLATLIPITDGLLSLPRFVFWQMPFLYGVVRIIRGRRWLEVAWFAMAGVFAAIVLLAWYSGKDFVL